MILSRRLAGDFSPTVRDRGKSYYWQGRVRIHHGSDSLVEALVRGSRKYEVSLDYENGVLFTACNCDNFNPLSPCKHVWATLLAAESRGYLQTPAQQAELLLEPVALRPPGVAPPPPPPPRIPAWKNEIAGLTRPAIHTASPVAEWPDKREILYLVEGSSSIATGGLVIRLMTRDRKLDGSYSREVSASLKRNQIARLPRKEDREILAPLAGGMQHYSWSLVSDNTPFPDATLVPHPLADSILRLAVRTGRCYVRTPDFNLATSLPLTWDDGAEWEFRLEIRRRPERGWIMAGILRRGDERMDLSDATLVTPGGFVFAGCRVAPLAADTPIQWIVHFRRPGQVILISENDTDELLATLLCSPGIPAVDLPEELRYEETVLTPRPSLRIKVAGAIDNSAKKVRAELSFDYEGRAVDAAEATRGFFDPSSKRLLRRDTAFENAAAALLTDLGMKFRAGTYDDRSRRWEMASSKLPRALRALVDAGWHIDADGKTFRRPGRFNIQVDTTLDWFELHGDVDYGETTAQAARSARSLAPRRQHGASG